MAQMTYKMTLAQGMTLNRLVIHHRIINIVDDRKSPVLYEGSEIVFITNDLVEVEVEVSSPMVGLEWRLDVMIEGVKLTEEPIICITKPSGKANVTLKLPWL